VGPRPPAAARLKRLPDLAAPSGVEAYIRAINRIPLLTETEERRLLSAMRLRHDRAAAATLIEANLRFVVPVARSFSGLHQPLGDLIQEGNLALLQAIRRFRPFLGSRLVPYLVRQVRSRIADFVMNGRTLVPVELTQAQRELYFQLRKRYGDAWHELKGAGMRRAAMELKLRPDAIRLLQSTLSGYDLSLMKVERRRRPLRAGMLEFLADRNASIEACHGRMERERLLARLHLAIHHLDRRSADIIQRRWLSPGPKASLRQLASVHRISGERVRQLERQAFKTIRASLAASE
jgi:RNA polymerase sigma-32 factor